MNSTTDAPILGLSTPGQRLRGGAGPDLLEATPTAPGGLQTRDTNRLLWTETLNALVENGYTELPPFPSDAINVKPVYKLISAAESNNGDLYAMPAWPALRTRRIGRQR